MRERLLEGAAALVTGGSSGIGAAICRAFAREGAKVAINYVGEGGPAEAMVREIAAQGGKAIAVGGDVSRELDVIAMFERAIGAFGRIDIAVANAGIQRDAGIEHMSLEQWNQVIATNLTGQFLTAREAVRRMLHHDPLPDSPARGKILCTSSVHELIPWAGHVNYTASKAGVHMMMQSLAQEVAPRRIRVNAIAPGAIRTAINRPAWSTPEALEKLLKLIPYGRVGEPEDIAKAAVWLASDESDYVTGATLFVDGGMTLFPTFAANG